LEANYSQQTQLGVNALLPDQAALKSRFPSMGVSDIALGCLSPEDATLTTTKILKGFCRKAEELGVKYIESSVCALKMGNGRVRPAQLENDAQIQALVYCLCLFRSWNYACSGCGAGFT
jgi:glycine/D-amino acid oxidase-like deaminating enzyme